MNTRITPSNIIATKDPNAFVGAIVMWHLYGDVERDELRRSWLAYGLNEDLLPELPSPEVCLTRAVEEFSRGTIFKRRIKGGGYRLVREDKADQEKADYATECSVMLDEQDNLVFTRFSGEDLSQELTQAFAKHKKQLSGRDISPWLCGQMMQHLKATNLKSNGGVYFIPREQVETFKQIKLAIESVAGHRLYMVQAMTTDEAVEMVLDAITREAEGEISAVETDLAQVDEEGNRVLGVRALNTRADRCKDMIKKVKEYEKLLGTKLDVVRKRLDDLKVAAMEASIAAKEKSE